MSADAAWPQALAGVVILFAACWGTFQAFWVWLWLSIERTNARPAGRAGTLTPGKEKILRHSGQLVVVGLIATALALIVLGYARAVIAQLVAPGHRAIAAALGVAATGFALLICGGVRLVLNSGKAISSTEIADDLRRSKSGPKGRSGLVRFRQSSNRHLGVAESDVIAVTYFLGPRGAVVRAQKSLWKG